MSAMVHQQVTFTVYRLPRSHWHGYRIWLYSFSYHGMWAFAFRVLWFGFELHNNSVWSFEDEVVLKARGLT